MTASLQCKVALLWLLIAMLCIVRPARGMAQAVAAVPTTATLGISRSCGQDGTGVGFICNLSQGGAGLRPRIAGFAVAMHAPATGGSVCNGVILVRNLAQGVDHAYKLHAAPTATPLYQLTVVFPVPIAGRSDGVSIQVSVPGCSGNPSSVSAWGESH